MYPTERAITAQEASQKLHNRKKISGVTIVGDIRLYTSVSGTVSLENVVVTGKFSFKGKAEGITFRNSQIQGDLDVIQSSLGHLDLKGTTVTGALTVSQVQFPKNGGLINLREVRTNRFVMWLAHDSGNPVIHVDKINAERVHRAVPSAHLVLPGGLR